MTIRLVYFAWVREQIGLGQEEFPATSPIRLDHLVDALEARSAAHALALGDRSRLRAAVDQAFAGWDVLVSPGSEVAIFPPVTGG